MIKQFALSLLVASTASAVETQFFIHQTSADFEAGKLENVVVTNYSELKLARRVDELFDSETKSALAQVAGVIEALAQTSDGTLYIGSSVGGKVLMVRDKKLTTVLDLGDQTSVLSLYADGNTLYIGTGGEQAKLLRLEAGQNQATEIAIIDNAQYIWEITSGGAGKLLLATGPNGVLVVVDPDTQSQSVLFDSDENNLLSLAFDGKETAYVGTDPNGLIYKVDVQNGNAFVLYDANESEIGSLLLDPKGFLYAGTSQFIEATEETEASESVEGGRPDSSLTEDIVITDEPPELPTPPEPEPVEGRLGATDESQPQVAAEQPMEEPAEDEPAKEEVPDALPPQLSPSGPTQVVVTEGEEASDGNAVYRLDPNGFVSEVLRANVMIFDLEMQNGKLLIGCGATGEVRSFDPKNEETFTLARVDQSHVTAMLAASDGTLYVASGSPGSLYVLGDSVAKEGTYTSPVLDAAQVSRWGKAQFHGVTPQGSSITVATRSSNIGDEDSDAWSEWSEEKPVGRFIHIDSPTARFLQYRLTFSGNGKTTPAIDEVHIAYQSPNLSPRIDSITIDPPVAPEAGVEPVPTPVRNVNWSVSDSNSDKVTSKLELRVPGGAWIALADGLEEMTWSWDTRQVPDGRYEIRVQSSDALSNAPGMAKTASRISEAVIIDNTPPVIGDISTSVEKGRFTVNVRVADRTGLIRSLEYKLDGAKDWQRVLPADSISDSPDEQYTVVLNTSGKATRVLSLRASDDSYNVAHQSVTLKPQ